VLVWGFLVTGMASAPAVRYRGACWRCLARGGRDDQDVRLNEWGQCEPCAQAERDEYRRQLRGLRDYLTHASADRRAHADGCAWCRSNARVFPSITDLWNACARSRFGGTAS
jgi:hypothetical protein